MKLAIEKITDSLDLLDAYGEEYGKISAAKSMLTSAIDDLRKIETAFYAEKSQGVTLCDYFAGQALAGMCVGEPPNNHRGIAQWCYQMADAMLAAREGKDALEKT